MINTLFDSLFEEYWVKPQNTIQDKGDFYELKIELAGYSRKDVEVEASDDFLTIRTVPEDRRKKFSLRLLKKVDTENISCKMENGLLHLELPKKGVVKPTKIKVN